jgi:CPA1 family monovalent cation:H+ antiporter
LTVSDAEIFIGLLAAIALLAQLARWLSVPYPVSLVLGGLALGFVPGLPAPDLDPDIFFFLFLPPLLYSEAFLYSTEELKAVATEIFLLAVGLVVVTAVAVAAVAHAVAGLPWPAAFVLGAVVGPTDPVSATSVIRRLRVSDRVVTILEGEALVNDATALVAFKLAVAAAGASAFSLGHAFAEFLWVSLGGVLTGMLVAWLASRARRWITVMEVEITLSLLIPFAAYLPAERLGVSGVLAAVTAGLLIGRQAHMTSAGTRLRRYAFWEVLVFLLNSTLFLLIGLAFPDILDELGKTPSIELVWQATVLAGSVVALRLAWMFLVPRVVSALEPVRTGRPSVGELVVLGWSGMRGGVSLAAALSIPVAAAGHAFPGRAEIIFYAYMIVLATLVIPSLTLGPLIRRLEVGNGEAGTRRDAKARAHILHAALEHIEELAHNDELPEDIAERLRELYQSRLDRLQPQLGETLLGGESLDDSSAFLAARRSTVAAQRAALAELEQGGQIGNTTAREVEHELNLEEQACN